MPSPCHVLFLSHLANKMELLSRPQLSALRTQTQGWASLVSGTNDQHMPNSNNSAIYLLVKETSSVPTTAPSAPLQNASLNHLCIYSRIPWTSNIATSTAEPPTQGLPATEALSMKALMTTKSTVPSKKQFYFVFFFSFLQRKKLTVLIQHILELKFYIPLVLFGILTNIF